MAKRKTRIVFNAPATIGFCAICFVVMILNACTGYGANRYVFSVFRSSPLNPLTYLRLFTHVLGHASWDHFFNNILYILVLGPILEEKYGSRGMIFLYLISALVTGLLCVIFLPQYRMLGASGIVFALILLASFTGTESDEIPLTFILVAVFYIIQQVSQAITSTDNVAYLGHFGGGAVGAAAGYLLNRKGFNSGRQSSASKWGL